MEAYSVRSLLSRPRSRLAALLAVLALFLAACDTGADDTIRDWLAPVEEALRADGFGDGGEDALFFEEDGVAGIADEALTPDPDLLAEDDELPLEEDEVVGIEDEKVEDGGRPAADEPPVSAAGGAPEGPPPAATSDAGAIVISTVTPAPAATGSRAEDDAQMQGLGIVWQGNRFELTGRVDAIYEGAGQFEVSYPDNAGYERTRSVYLRPGRTFADYDFVEGDVVRVRGERVLNAHLVADSIRWEPAGSQ